jgi:hypothetical protein
MATDSELPIAFVDRPSSPTTPFTPMAALLYRRAIGTSIAVVFWGVLAVVVTIFFFLPGLFFIAVALYYCKKLARIFGEAFTGRIRRADCPNCGKSINFWVPTGFPCPYCQQMLLLHGDRLYSLSS